jgi:hypothetical protein
MKMMTKQMTEMMSKQAQTLLPMETEPKHTSAWDEELPRLTKRQIEALIEARADFDEEIDCPELLNGAEKREAIRELYVFLRKYATRTQACYIIRYPDLVWEFYDAFCNTDPDIYYDPYKEADHFSRHMREKVDKLAKEAVRRFRNGEAWQGYYEKRLAWENIGRFLPAPSEQGYGHYETD